MDRLIGVALTYPLACLRDGDSPIERHDVHTGCRHTLQESTRLVDVDDDRHLRVRGLDLVDHDLLAGGKRSRNYERGITRRE